MRSFFKPQKGFTLIELLVVMAVMSILVGVGINTFTIAQKKARDAKRKADLRTVQTAIEAYKVNNNVYPAGPSSNATNGVNGTVGESRSNATGWIQGLTPNYLSTLPVDPLAASQTFACTTNLYEDTRCYGYSYYTDPRGYSLWARLEDTQDRSTCQFQNATSPFGSSATGGYVYGSITCLPASANYNSFYVVFGYN